MRGPGGLAPREQPRPGLTLRRVTVGIVFAIAAVLAVAELTDKDPEPPKSKVATAAGTTRTPSSSPAPPSPSKAPLPVAKAAAPTTPPTKPVVVPPPNPTFKSSSLAPAPSVPASKPTSPAPAPNPTFKPSAAASTLTRPRTESVVPRPAGNRTIPVGTSKTTAKVFAKIPLAPRDRAPIGHIAPSGLHVDRIALGTGYEANRCTGPSSRFPMDKVDEISVCLRAVHLRQGERLTVRWEREGLLMRTTRLYIPPKHAYRTRAGLRLRPGYTGRWTVRIMTADGTTELAAAPFDIS